MHRLWAISVLTTLGILGTGCGISSPPSSGAVVRDSSGTRIFDLPASATSDRSIRVVRDSSFSVPGSIEFGTIVDVSVSDNVVAVLDALEASVTTLDMTGGVIARFGRLGGGPGEFSPGGLASIVATSHAVWVPDILSERLTGFAVDGSIADILPLPLSEGHAVDWTAHPEGGYTYRLGTASGDLLIHAAATGIDTLYQFPPSHNPPGTVLPATPLWTVLPDGSLLVGWTDHFEIELLGPNDNRPIWIVRREGATREVTDADERHIHSLLEQSLMSKTGGEISTDMRERLLSGTRLPARAPVLSSIRSGPGGTIWIERAREIGSFGIEALRVGQLTDIGSAMWEVYSRDGSFRTAVELPANFEVHEIVGTLIYGVEVDELGVQTVRRLRVETN